MSDTQPVIDPSKMTPEQAHAEAVRRIEAAAQSGQHWLDLGDLPLEQIPPQILKLKKNLCELSLGQKSFEPIHDDQKVYRHEVDRKIKDISIISKINKIIRLDLSGLYRLVDTSALSDLINLEEIYLSECISIKSFQFIELMKNLRLLDLRGCNNVCFFEFPAIPKSVNELNLSCNNKIKFFPELKGAEGVKILYLSSCEEITTLKNIEKLKSLESIHLDGCHKLRSISALKNLNKLRTLDLYQCFQVKSLDPISKLKNLEHLNAGYCTDVEKAPKLLNLPKLNSLYFWKCFSLTDISNIRNSEQIMELSLYRCGNITNIDAISSLKNIELVDLGWCEKIDDLSPIVNLKKLKSLRTSGIKCNFRPWELTSWPALEELHLETAEGCPEELTQYGSYNCLPRLRAWLADLEQGEADTHDLKLFFLGNGRVGKSELFGRLRGEKFHGQRETTHGIQLGRFALGNHRDGKPIFCNAWDFGGQDIYLGTHALFLKSRALFVLAWHPDMETDAPYTEAVSGLQMRHRPLRYWLDYIHALAGPEARVIVVQTQCATEHAKRAPDLGDTARFAFIEAITSCAEQDDGVDMLQLTLKRAARHRLERPAPPRMPASWLAVRDRLFALRDTEKTIDRARFDAICAETHHGASAEALLHYLHQAGDVFHQAGVFGGAIVLDQQWALDGIYTLFKRDGVLPHLRQNGGVFSPDLLSALAWSGRYSEREQALLLSMMESCDLVFPLQEYGHSPQYVMADALPDAAESSARIDREWRNAAVTDEVVAEYAFLHDGILRALLGRIGRLAGPHAVYWRYALCAYDQRTRSTARIDSVQRRDGGGEIRIRASGENGSELCAQLLEVLEDIQIGTPPRIHGKPAPRAHREPPHENTESAAETFKFAPQPASTSGKPAVYFSYSHGGTERPDLMRAAEALESALAQEFDVIRDKNALHNGQRISDFMREIGRGTRVLILLSDRYLRSAYCMQELLYLYQRHLAEPTELLKHVLPVVIDQDLRCDHAARAAYLTYWKAQSAALKHSISQHEPEECRAMIDESAAILDFLRMVDPMLKFLDDILMPRGAAIASDDYAAIKLALRSLPDTPPQRR